MNNNVARFLVDRIYTVTRYKRGHSYYYKAEIYTVKTIDDFYCTIKKVNSYWGFKSKQFMQTMVENYYTNIKYVRKPSLLKRCMTFTKLAKVLSYDRSNIRTNGE